MRELKTIILGIDGATWDIIKYQVDIGNLRSFKELMKDGTWGSLESCIPPLTGPAWTSIATGKNPGRTGAFDFLNRTNKKSLATKTLNSWQIRRAKPFWDILSQSNYSVGIWNYPMLFPPYKINGFIVSGLGSYPKDEICYPTKLKQELFSVCNNYKIDIPHGSNKYIDNEILFIKNILELLRDNEKIIEYLLKNKDVNIFFGVINALDFMQHYLWKHIDKNHPMYKKDNPFRDEFFKLLKRIDDIIWKIKMRMPNNTNIFIISDHGFGSHESTFYINQFLANKHLLRRRSQIEFYYRLITNHYREIIASFLYKTKRKQLLSIFSENLFEKIDIKKSIAISINSVGMGGITINPLIYNNKEDYEKVRSKVIRTLKEIEQTLKIKCEIFLPENIYCGKFTCLAPDIIFRLNDLATAVSLGFSKDVYINPHKNSNHSGGHRSNGIFLAYGPDIKKGSNVKGTKIYDIAPTILHMFNLPIPKDIDGRVLKEIFSEDSDYVKKEIRYKKYNEEQEVLKEKIRKLKLNGKL